MPKTRYECCLCHKIYNEKVDAVQCETEHLIDGCHQLVKSFDELNDAAVKIHKTSIIVSVDSDMSEGKIVGYINKLETSEECNSVRLRLTLTKEDPKYEESHNSD